MPCTLSVLALALAVEAGNPDDARRAASTTEPAASRQTIRITADDLERFQLPRTVELPGASTPWFRASGVGMFAASGADLVTTELGLSRGLSEANPAARGRGVRIATHVAAPAVLWWATERMERSGKPKTALLLRVALMAAYSVAAAHNVRLMNGQPATP